MPRAACLIIRMRVMDAGLAAVLGATVGALGTGGAGVVVALLTRSQARLQLHAEHLRLAREPRKNTYAAFAEIAIKVHTHLTEAEAQIAVASRPHNASAREEMVEEANSQLQAAEEAQKRADHLQSLVYIEGPRAVISSVVELSSALVGYRHRLMAALRLLKESGECDGGTLEALETDRGDSYTKYVRYLYAASDTIGDSGLPERRQR